MDKRFGQGHINLANPINILAINGGSSSLKVGLFERVAMRQLVFVEVNRIGSLDSTLVCTVDDHETGRKHLGRIDANGAIDQVLNLLADFLKNNSILGIGHRVVHGGPKYSVSQAITPQVMEDLRNLEPFDPEHLPSQILFIDLLKRRFPAVLQVACFDTGFHQNLPAVSRRLPIPRHFDSVGVRRYGFHGISFRYLMSELQRLDHQAANGKVILAHLGSGASLAAVDNGKCIDTSMSLTPASGILMGTRSGDLDPGLIDFLARTTNITIEQFNRMVHLESGLLGISESTADMEQLLSVQSVDQRAAEAVEIFCYNVRKCIGAYAAAMGGVDAIVFAGGIGQHSPEIRWRVCRDLEFVGIELDQELNRENAAKISTSSRSVAVRVIPTREEEMIARDVLDIAG